MHYKVEIYKSDSTNPYYNLAMERALLEGAKEGTLTLFLWQNERTVVIGRHQNAYLDVNLKRLYADEGVMARRLTGGGAVFHDSGNLNFSFISKKKEYDVAENNAIIVEALRFLGFTAKISGRNDIEINERKVSGNAYLKNGESALHHGTLLISVDTSRLENYLNVPPDKLSGKGVASVKARVVNLAELNANIDVNKVISAILAVLEEKFGSITTKSCAELDVKLLELYEGYFADRGFLFGSEVRLESNKYKRFDWGYADVHFTVTEGVITQVEIFSDALDVAEMEGAIRALTGASVIKGFSCEGKIANDIYGLIVNNA